MFIDIRLLLLSQCCGNGAFWHDHNADNGNLVKFVMFSSLYLDKNGHKLAVAVIYVQVYIINCLK